MQAVILQNARQRRVSRWLVISVIFIALGERHFRHPRSIPEIGRNLGLAVGHYDHASYHLKRSWESCLSFIGLPTPSPSEFCDVQADFDELIDLILNTIEPESGGHLVPTAESSAAEPKEERSSE